MKTETIENLATIHGFHLKAFYRVSNERGFPEPVGAVATGWAKQGRANLFPVTKVAAYMRQRPQEARAARNKRSARA